MEAPVIEDLRRRLDRSVEIVLVNVWEGNNAAAEAQQFADIWQVAGPVLLDETASYARELQIRGVPTNVFVGADGIVQEVGATRADELNAAADRLAAS